MNKTEIWWRNEGYKKLDSILVGANPLMPRRFKKNEIGNVPVSNLILIPEGLDKKYLAQLITEDGIPAIATNEIGNDSEIMIKL